MHHSPVRPTASTRWALTAALLALVTALLLIFTATPLHGKASAAGPALKEWPTRTLSPEWQWPRKTPSYDSMFRQRPARQPQGSFDRVLEMARP